MAADAASRIREVGGDAFPSDIILDSRDSCRSLVQTTLEKFGRLDILIHNAGWVAYQSVQELTPDFLHRAISINLEAPTWLVQARGITPKERLLATFDVLREWYSSPNFRGCPFINAVLELADASHKAHQVSVDLRESIRQIIVRFAESTLFSNT